MRIRVKVKKSVFIDSRTFGLEPLDFKVLTTLQYITGVTDDIMAKIMDLPKSQMYGSFKRLEKNGIVLQNKYKKALDLSIQISPLKVSKQNRLNMLKKLEFIQKELELVQKRKRNIESLQKKEKQEKQEKQEKEKEKEKERTKEKEKEKEKEKKEKKEKKERKTVNSTNSNLIGPADLDEKEKQIQDKWLIANKPNHPKYKLVHKAIAHGFESIYAKIRQEAKVPRHYNKNGSQNKYFFKAAIFCREQDINPLKYVRFAQETYSWVNDMAFPTPSNIAGDWLANRWLSKPLAGKKSGLGGHTYVEPTLDLKAKLVEAGFTYNYSNGDCRHIINTAQDLNNFGTLDLTGVKFSSEIMWFGKQLKAGGIV